MSRKLAVHAEKEHYIDVLGRNALTRSEVAAFHDEYAHVRDEIKQFLMEEFNATESLQGVSEEARKLFEEFSDDMEVLSGWNPARHSLGDTALLMARIKVTSRLLATV